ncbi:hypothetical protein [Streptomyces luteireticuli]|uniref:Beta/gamma crystallin 'Greek key' domain-containing protein n=1 Tax=Streptomyces luteireticuli TaxID=173858 RepID=A0ABN0Z4A4_9ACTN
MKPVRALAALGLGTLAALSAVASPAVAQDAKPARATTAQHCVINTDNNSKSCFSSYRAAISAATKGRVTDAPDDTRAAAHDKKLQERLSGPRSQHGAKLAKNTRSAAAENRVLATIYSDKDFGGNSLSLLGSSGCHRYDYFANLYDGWNDSISSTASGQCDITLFQHANFLGFSQTYRGAVPYVGDAMNDQASSISF